MSDDEVLSGHLQELRRGTVVLACLETLATPRYGYALLETLEAAGFPVEGNTLYPLLRRLEKQGLLTSAWNTEEPRPRKFYQVTSQGRSVLGALKTEWSGLDESIRALGQETR